MGGLLELLVQKNLVTAYQLDQLRGKTGPALDEALFALGVPGDKIRQAKSQLTGIPDRAVTPQSVSFQLFAKIPEDAAAHYRFVPIGTQNGVLQVGMLDPMDLEARNALQFITSKSNIPTEVFLISYEDFQAILEAYRGMGTGSPNTDIDGEDDVMSVGESTGDSGTNTRASKDSTIVEDAPATKTIAVILKNAIEGGASDIHIEHTGADVKIRYRVDGILYTSLRTDKALHSALVARVKVLAKLKLDERRKPQDGRFMASVDGRTVDFRVSILPTFFGEKVVIRILDPEKGVKKLDDVGLTAEHLQMVRDAIARPYGLILITGPTGSGKTTTLYAMLQELDREKLNIISLEEPVEYVVAGINQSQVRPEIGYTFATGLRSILRQDPDVIMVGEIRDKETAQLAINAALTGHLVFATLHTNNAIGVVPRLVDMGVDPYLIAPTLALSMAQRLVRRVAPGAGRKTPIDAARQEFISKEFEDLPAEFKGKIPISDSITETGKPGAPEDGTKGRIAVFEMFPVDKELERIILSKPTELEIGTYARTHGMLTMREDAILKSMQGLVPWSEVHSL